MIRITRPSDAPAILLGRGVAAGAALRAAHDADPQAYLDGRKRFDFDADIYAVPEVKLALRRMQHDKCAFCESKFSHTGYGDVEHYRPKAGYRQRPDRNLGRPG
jgi:hypothetical protein